MVNRNLIRSLDDDEIVNELAVLAPEEEADEWLLDWLEQDQQDYAQGEIVDVPFRTSVNPNIREVVKAKGLDYAE